MDENRTERKVASFPQPGETLARFKERRQQFQQKLADHDARVRELQAEIVTQVQTLLTQLESDRVALTQNHQHVQEQTDRLKKHASRLAQARSEIADRRAQLEEQQAASEASQAELIKDLQSRQKEVEQQAEECRQKAALLAEGQADLETRRQAMFEQTSVLADRLEECSSWQEQLTADEDALQADRDLFEQESAKLAEAQAALAAERTLFAAKEADLHQQLDAIALERTSLAQWSESLSAQQALLEDSRQQLDAGHESLAAEREAIRKQQQAAAEAARGQPEAASISIEEKAAWEARLAACQKREQDLQECEELLASEQRDLRQRQTEWTERAQQQEQALEARVQEQLARLDALQAEIAGLNSQQQALAFGQAPADLEIQARLQSAEDDVQLLQLELETTQARCQQAESEVAQLTERLSDQSRLHQEAEAQGQSSWDMVAQLHHQREVENVQGQLRLLQQQNDDLRARLMERPASAIREPMDVINQDTSLDWESQKKRMFEILNRLDEEETDSTLERSGIERLVSQTEQIIAAKNEEIGELRCQLAMISGASTENTVHGAVQVAMLLDADQLVQQEREKLMELQGEWQEKLRLAEVELSMERAKVARERLEIEELVHKLKGEQSVREETPVKKAGWRKSFLS